MTKMVRCKACGYLMPEAKLGDKCPACGALRTVFEPYTDPMGEKRRRILNLDLHPMAVHFPTAFAVAILVFSIGVIFLTGIAGQLLICTLGILTLFLPLVVLVAFLAGLRDGTARFRHIKNSHILKMKIIVGVIYLVLSIALTLLVWLKGFDGPVFLWVAVILAAGCVGCTVVLSLYGKSILNSSFPGN
jgi:uncharacterized membrane protein/phage FluMu protein Com